MNVKNKLSLILMIAGFLLIGSLSASAQVQPTLFFTMFWDTSSTFNGEPLPIGTIVKAYDPDGIQCGEDTTVAVGWYGFLFAYGDDPTSTGVDEGAVDNDTIRFKINDHWATVTAGDSTWTDGAEKQATLEVTTAVIAMSAINLPIAKAVAPERTIEFQVDVRNDGDGLDFYGVKLSMTVDDTISNPGIFDWEALEPDSVIYANPGETAAVFFSIKAPKLNADTVNTISYTVFSHLDTTVTVTGNVDVIMTITDVDDHYATLPGSFELLQNYPNPFNPSTVISFNLSVRTVARLDIIDVLGRLVESRELGELSAGPHKIDYDAYGMASGVYFYRLITENSSQSKKMILLR